MSPESQNAHPAIPRFPDETEPRQANNLEPFPRYIPSLVQFHMELTGAPVELESGLRFLPAVNGYLDRAVQ